MTSSSTENRTNLVSTWFALNLLLLALVAILSLTYPVEELNRRLGDAFFRLRVHQPTSSTVGMVLIDDASLERYGRWPWPRRELARLVDGVSKQHPSSIGLDILLAESDDSAGDNILAEAIGGAGNVVLAAKLSSADRLWTDPLTLFRARAAAVGHVQAAMDPDGIVRRVPLVEVSADGPRWPLAIEMARLSTGQAVRLSEDAIWLDNRRIRLEGQARHTRGIGWSSYALQFLSIDFLHQFVDGEPNPPFITISAAQVLDGDPSPSLRGKNVLIGFGASDLGDRVVTPVSGQLPMPGVEVHANLLQSLLAGRGIRHAGLGPQLILLLIYSLISTLLVLQRPGWLSIWIPAALFAAIYAAGFVFFNRRAILLDFGPLVCAAVLAVPLAQLQDLVIVNRALNRGLQQLRSTLLPRPGQLRTFRAGTNARDSARALQQKLDLIQSMQSELASLYTFRQNLLESMQEGLAVFDSTGKMEFCNPFWVSFCLQHGWNPQIGLVEFGQLLGHPRWSNLAQQMIEGSSPPESEIHLQGGFWQVRCLRLHAENSARPSWMVVVTDLTSRLERDQARAEALRFVTHELRTPLVSIQGFAEFLMRYPKADDSKEAAATVFRESQRLVSLINTYLDVLRFDAGARSLRKEPILIPEMVAQVEKIMAPIADSAEIHVRVELDPTLPALVGDRPMLTGVLLNLLNNAVKYSPGGSEVALAVCSDQTSAIFEVRNPGSPIPPERLAHLFEPFYQAHEHEISTPGWGLGLTFVKRIVEEHHGTINATSDEHEIKVRVRVPVDESGHVASQQKAEVCPFDPSSVAQVPAVPHFQKKNH
jgi:signal transduction histidine kinase/CHASE2 domain-containing sensor protein